MTEFSSVEYTTDTKLSRLTGIPQGCLNRLSHVSYRRGMELTVAWREGVR